MKAYFKSREEIEEELKKLPAFLDEKTSYSNKQILRDFYLRIGYWELRQAFHPMRKFDDGSTGLCISQISERVVETIKADPFSAYEFKKRYCDGLKMFTPTHIRIVETMA